jgi:hypothetical protein
MRRRDESLEEVRVTEDPILCSTKFVEH